MDGLSRLVESFIQGIIAIIQPLFEGGNLGYFLPVVLLLIVSVHTVTHNNRLNWLGYVLGWLIAVSVMGVYMESSGDTLLVNLTGPAPRVDFLAPGVLGFLAAFLLLFPFIRMKLSDASPFVVSITTAGSIILLFLTWRATESVPVVTSAGLEELIIYRKRYMGVFALGFSMGVLLHILLSAANPPRPPVMPPASR